MQFSRATRTRGKKSLYQVFRLGQRIGVDVLPRHFYSAVPDLTALESTHWWREPSTMPGVRGTDVEAQLAEVAEWFTPGVRERLEQANVYGVACERNGAVGYGPMETQVLYAFVATRRPKRVVQVGAGVSTAVILQAAADHDVDLTLTCVDPYPTEMLRELAATGRINLVEEPAQTVSLEVLTALEAGDLLFIDSTHTVKVGSEVNRLILEVLPQLAEGVVVHIHDVMFPFDYPVDLFADRLFFWDESTLLHAFLIGNSHARILVSGSMLHHSSAAEFARVLVGYRPAPTQDGLYTAAVEDTHFPSSTWILID